MQKQALESVIFEHLLQGENDSAIDALNLLCTGELQVFEQTVLRLQQLIRNAQNKAAGSQHSGWLDQNLARMAILVAGD